MGWNGLYKPTLIANFTGFSKPSSGLITWWKDSQNSVKMVISWLQCTAGKENRLSSEE